MRNNVTSKSVTVALIPRELREVLADLMMAIADTDTAIDVAPLALSEALSDSYIRHNIFEFILERASD